VADKKEVVQEEKNLHDLAKELGLRIMTDKELREFTKKVEESASKKRATK